MKRTSRPQLQLLGCLLAMSTLLHGCGGGSDGDDGRASPPANYPYNPGCTKFCTTTPPLPLTATTPSARWEYGFTRFEVFGPISLALSADQTVAGLSHADFYVDGQRVDTVSLERPLTNARRDIASYLWLTGLSAEGYHTLQARVFTKDGIVDDLPPAVLKVHNNRQFSIVMSPTEVAPQPTNSFASGNGQIDVNLATGAASGSIALANMTATEVHIHDGSATDTGPILLSFEYDGVTDRWALPAGSTFRSQGVIPTDVLRLITAQFYVDAHSVTFPSGELRRQLLLPTTRMNIGMLQNQAVGYTDTALVAIAADPFENFFRFNVYLSSDYASGSLAIYLTPPTSDLDRIGLLPKTRNKWSGSESYLRMHDDYNQTVRLDVSSYPSSSPPQPFYSPVPSITLDPVPTLSELQATIFTPKCSTCHNGVGATLPGSMDLTAGHTRASLQGVDSLQQSNLKRVSGAYFSSSYLLHKLVGARSITGARMPLGGPYLTDAEISRIERWFAFGRPD